MSQWGVWCIEDRAFCSDTIVPFVVPTVLRVGLSVDDLSEPLRVLDAHLAAADELSCDYCRDTGRYQIDGVEHACECMEEP